MWKQKTEKEFFLSKCAMCDSKKSKFIKEQVNTRYKMNEIVNYFLLAGDKFRTEMHLRELGYI